jgi:DNA-3-methyladenine glycosylase I
MGVPLHDDTGLFEFLILEGAQRVVLGYDPSQTRELSEGFDKFDVNKVARYADKRIEKLLQDEASSEID